MTISKHTNWGVEVSPPDDLVICQTDRDASEFIGRLFAANEPVPPIAIIKSNIARAVGKQGAVLNSSKMLSTRFDLIAIEYQDYATNKDRVFSLGYAILRNSWWRGELTGVFNTSFIGNLDFATRAHPNDGKLNLITVAPQMKLSQRLFAYRRLRLGTHLPHPDIKTSQIKKYVFDGSLDSKKRMDLYFDDQVIRSVENCEITVLSDALTLHW